MILVKTGQIDNVSNIYNHVRCGGHGLDLEAINAKNSFNKHKGFVCCF